MQIDSNLSRNSMETNNLDGSNPMIILEEEMAGEHSLSLGDLEKFICLGDSSYSGIFIVFLDNYFVDGANLIDTLVLSYILGSPMESWLFHVGNFFIMSSLLTFSMKHGQLISRSCLVIGFLFHCDWSLKVICSPLVFTWNVALLSVNIAHLIHLFYVTRKVKFSSKYLERVYTRMFAPLGISRLTFQKMTSFDVALVHQLEAGEAYSIQNLTKNDRLGLLISGRVNVISNNNHLHQIEPFEFLDSPEFESQRMGPEDTMKVSIIAAVPCRYMAWDKSNLEFHLIKELFFAQVLALLIARDVADKLYTMNRRIMTSQGIHLDIRLVLRKSLPLNVKRDSKDEN